MKQILWTQEMADRLDDEIQTQGISLTIKLETLHGLMSPSDMVGKKSGILVSVPGWCLKCFYLYLGSQIIAKGYLATDGNTFHVFNTSSPNNAVEALQTILTATQTRDDRPMEMIPEDYYAL